MRITLPSGTAAELARPDGDALRGVVVVTDIMGLRPLFDDLCARLASEHGWVVCAVEPFPGREDLDLQGRMEAAAGLDDERQLGDLVAAADACGVAPVAVMGFCMGGMYAMKASATGRFDRAVAFYGMIRVPADWRGPGQGEPLDAVRSAGACPVLAIVGERDHYTPSADVDELVDAGATVVRYPEAEHGFVHDPARPAHRAGDAADAWGHVIAFLQVEPDAAGDVEPPTTAPLDR
ncbi:MAG TPA: dienelactone hydrolase family protein [Acidimicrobiales bacterium]